MNGALTVGTHDGATIEMAEEAGKENFFLFGLTADQVVRTRPWYNPHWHYDHCPETRRALDAIFSNRFSRAEPGIFEPIRQILLEQGDRYMHLADLDSYVKTQDAVQDVYKDPDAWFRKVIHNVGASGKFSSDRAVREYAREIWGVPLDPTPGDPHP
jgi:starch phosphorylase